MDDARFDALTRQVGSSRRGLLHMASGLVTGFLLLLHAGTTQARCRRVCHRRNGRRVCRKRCSPERQGPRLPNPCRELRATCTTDTTCCGGNTNRVDCAFVDPFKAKGLCGPAFLGNRCCTTEGWECTSPCDCCGSMACVNGTCRYSLLGQSCETNAQCQAGTCQTVQAKHDNSCLIPVNQPPPDLCCLGEGGTCHDSCMCCGTLTCQDSVCSSFGTGSGMPGVVSMTTTSSDMPARVPGHLSAWRGSRTDSRVSRT